MIFGIEFATRIPDEGLELWPSLLFGYCAPQTRGLRAATDHIRLSPSEKTT